MQQKPPAMAVEKQVIWARSAGLARVCDLRRQVHAATWTNNVLRSCIHTAYHDLCKPAFISSL